MRNIILLTIILATFYACSSDPAKVQSAQVPSLPVFHIQSSSALTTAEYPASIQGTVDVEIRPQISGSLQKVLVDEGDFVTKGQGLFKINEQPFREQLNSALASMHASEASVMQAQLEIDKLTPLVQNKVVSDYQLKVAKANLKMAQANLEQTKAVVESAKINLGYTLITAPVSGYIGRLPKKQGSLVGITDPEPLTTLSDVHEVFAYFSLGETDFIHFKAQYAGGSMDEKIKNLPAVSLLLADNSTYSQPGKIDMVDGQFDKNTGAITLRAVFPNSRGLLRSGNTGKIILSLPHENAILVPQESTIEIQDKIFVFAVNKKNKVSKRPIYVLGTSGTDYIVKSGVKSGDRIIFKGFGNLQEGTIIHPEKAQQELAEK